ncbi:MAG: DUF1016 N-terminal domain-containing protein [Eubacteriales bacterium]
MKTLNHNIDTIVAAIRSCYSETTKPNTADLMNLYTTIGQVIAEQENTSFITILAKEITENCDNVKGFSARNLRRMRDFYVTYSCDQSLMSEALTIGWTQNAVIMESCETLEEMAFYIALTKEQNLSKVALVSAIEAKTFETSKQTKLQEKVAEIKTATSDRIALVSDFARTATVNTLRHLKKEVRQVFSKQRRLLRGSGPPKRRIGEWSNGNPYLQLIC